MLYFLNVQDGGVARNLDPALNSSSAPAGWIIVGKPAFLHREHGLRTVIMLSLWGCCEDGTPSQQSNLLVTVPSHGNTHLRSPFLFFLKLQGRKEQLGQESSGFFIRLLISCVTSGNSIQPAGPQDFSSVKGG